MSYEDYSHSVYTASFIDAAMGSSVPWDVFVLRCSTSCRSGLREINLGQKSSAASVIQQLDISLYRGGSTGTSTAPITPINCKGWANAPSAGGTVTGPSSATALTSAASLLYTDTTDVSGSILIKPDPMEMIFEAGQTLLVKASQPAAAVTITGTLKFEELPFLK